MTEDSLELYIFFPLGADSFLWEGCVVQESKQEVMKVVSL